MSLINTIKKLITGEQTDQVAIYLEDQSFFIVPVVWVGEVPSIKVDNHRRSEQIYLPLPSTGEFGFKKYDYTGHIEYPYGYVKWTPITERISKYYKPVVKTADSKSDSDKNKRGSNLF